MTESQKINRWTNELADYWKKVMPKEYSELYLSYYDKQEIKRKEQGKKKNKFEKKIPLIAKENAELTNSLNIMSTQEAAKFFNVTIRTIYNWNKKYNLEAINNGIVNVSKYNTLKKM